MEVSVKLNVEITEKSHAEFDVKVSSHSNGYEARIERLAITADGQTIKKALQGLVKQIQNGGERPSVTPMLIK